MDWNTTRLEAQGILCEVVALSVYLRRLRERVKTDLRGRN